MPTQETPESNPRENPPDSPIEAACIDSIAMVIPYKGFGLITLVRRTHDTSLL